MDPHHHKTAWLGEAYLPSMNYADELTRRERVANLIHDLGVELRLDRRREHHALLASAKRELMTYARQAAVRKALK